MKTIEKINQWVYNNPFKYHVYTKLPLVVLVIFYVIFFMEWIMADVTVKKLIEKLKKFDDNEEVIFYHLKDHNLESVELESVIETELGVEFTTGRVNDER